VPLRLCGHLFCRQDAKKTKNQFPLKPVNDDMNISLKPFFLSFALLFISFVSIECRSDKPKMKDTQTNDKPTIRYAAIGDSYTIGEGAREPDEAWPTLLTNHLQSEGVDITLVANPSKTGWTTQDVINNELPVYDQSNPTCATLLIGVNDWVQGVDVATFHKNLVFILDHMQSGLKDKNNLVLVTIPDFGVTPTGGQYAYGRDISAGIAGFNEIIKEEAKKRNLALVDIFPVSKNMKDHPELVAADGLHPSAREYAIWEEMIFPVVHKLVVSSKY
jgi:acyl-CoA thioesterase-1